MNRINPDQMNQPNNNDDGDEILLTVEVGREFLEASIEDAGGRPSPELIGLIVKRLKAGSFQHLQAVVRLAVAESGQASN